MDHPTESCVLVALHMASRSQTTARFVASEARFSRKRQLSAHAIAYSRTFPNLTSNRTHGAIINTNTNWLNKPPGETCIWLSKILISISKICVSSLLPSVILATPPIREGKEERG